MALGTAEYTPDTAESSAPTQTPPAQDQYTPGHEPALPTAEDWQNERLHASFDMPQYWETPETEQPPTPALEQVDQTDTVNQLSEIIRLQIADTQIGQMMIQLELLEMIERLQSALIRQIPAPQDGQQNKGK